MITLFKILFFSLFLLSPIGYSTYSSDFLLNSYLVLSKPSNIYRSELAKVYFPIHPGLYHQSFSRVDELLRRNIKLASLYSLGFVPLVTGQLSLIPQYLYYTLRKEPFTVLRGEGDIKKKKSPSFTLFNLNVCFLPGELPLFFGGVLPAADRVKQIADKIKAKDPDILCLYEVYDLHAAYKLLNCLKQKYAYFYLDIGGGLLDVDMSSGLFIASKFKISHPEFKLYQYQKMQNQINKGYFKFYVHDEESILAQIYTTHLQPYNRRSDQMIRVSELKEIVDEMSNIKNSTINYPLILCGDLNIPITACCEQKKILEDHFYNPSLEQKKMSYTYSSRLTDFLWNKQEEALLNEPQTIDYFLLFNKTKNFVHVKTEVLPMFDLDSPGNDLSDHNALFSTIEVGG